MAYEKLPKDFAESMARAADVKDVSSLEREISFCRAMLEANSTNPGLAVSLLSTLAKLCKEHELQLVRRRETIPRQDLQRIANAIVDLFVAEFEHLPEWETKVDRISEQLLLITGPDE